MTMGKNRVQHGKWLSTLTVCTAALGSLVLLSVPQLASAATTDTSSATTGAVATSGETATQSTTTNTDAAGDNTETTQPTDEANTTAGATTAPTTTESTDDTNQLKTSSSDLQTAVDTAKTTGVVVTQNPTKTVTTTPDQLADTVSSVKADNDAQAQALADATTKQEANQKTYDEAKQAVENDTLTITSNDENKWPADQIVKLLAGNGDVMQSNSDTDVVTGAKVSAVTEADKVAASDEAKVASLINLEADHKLVSTWDTKQQIGTNQPTWTYENAFTDAKTGRKVNIIETVTGFTQLNGAPADNRIQTIDSGDIGFQPTNIENVTATLKYVYADTGEAATIDAVLAFSDIDGLQGITVNNGYASVLMGNLVDSDDNGVFRAINNEGHANTDPDNQIWVLQKDVTETSYTFYVGLDMDNGQTASNTEPLQSVGGVAFSAGLPTVTPLVQEKASYTPTTIQVTTDYTVHYEGAGTATPADVTKVVTWTGNYDSDTDMYTWTPDNDVITAVTPIVNDYSAIVSTGWNLNTTSTDPANQTQTVTYYQVGTVADNTTTELTVHYVDTEGNELQPTLTDSGTIGDDFTQAPAVIEGYTTTDTAVSGTYDGNMMDLTFTYLKDGVPGDNQTTQLTVHYIDGEGNQLATDETSTGTIGDDFTQAPKQIEGYTTTDTAVSGTYDGNTMDLTFTYLKDGVPGDNQTTQLTVHYVDGDGNQLAADETSTGTIGDSFTQDPKQIEGYTTTDTAVNGTYHGNMMTLTFTYLKDGVPGDDQTTQLTVHYVDGDGHQLAADGTSAGAIGDGFTQTPKQIKGYTTTDKPVTGRYQGNNMDLTFTYVKDGKVATNTTTGLTIHYVDDHGNELIPATSQGGAIGTRFTVTAPTINDYTPMSQKTVTGTYQGNQMVLYFVYAPNANDNPTGTPTDETPDTPTSATTGTAPKTPTTPAAETITGMPASANGTAVAGSSPESEIVSNAQQNATVQTSQGTNGQYHLAASASSVRQATWQYAKTQVTVPRTSRPTVTTAQLPQTSDQADTTSTLLGLGLMGLLIGTFGRLRRKRQG